MKTTTPTPKSRVLAMYPEAKAVQSWEGFWGIEKGDDGWLEYYGHDTPRQAWARAAQALEGGR